MITRGVVLLVIAVALVVGVAFGRIEPVAAVVVFFLAVVILWFLAGAGAAL